MVLSPLHTNGLIQYLVSSQPEKHWNNHLFLDKLFCFESIVRISAIHVHDETSQQWLQTHKKYASSLPWECRGCSSLTCMKSFFFGMKEKKGNKKIHNYNCVPTFHQAMHTSTVHNTLPLSIGEQPWFSPLYKEETHCFIKRIWFWCIRRWAVLVKPFHCKNFLCCFERFLEMKHYIEQ